ncbi:MAG: hypothetical protein ACOY5W_13895 [Pseudomonadota bacterium]|jgi:hypothetical protein
MKPLTRIAAILMLATLTACQPEPTAEPFRMTDTLQQDLATVSGARIFFGHQSVGRNVMQGLEDLQNDLGKTQVTVLEMDGAAPELPDAFLLHSRVGENTRPASKCDDFKRQVDALAGRVDYALLKFCYIDINENSDVDAIFGYYRRTLDDLKARHPDITFVHVTSPLRHTASGPGVWIREVMGKPNRSKLANIKRNEFNERLRSTYAGDPIFDIAASESTYPDGRRESFVKDGKTYYSLIGAYTHDGGHLNETGRRHVAADMMRTLAGIIRARNAAAGGS